MEVKRCVECKQEKPLSDFFVEQRGKQGRKSRCKTCFKRKYPTPPWSARQQYKAWYQQPEVKARRAAAAQRYYRDPRLHPRWRARHVARRAIRKGILVRQPCEVCGVETTDAHHDDYEKPLEVRWFCRQHHAGHHADYDRHRAEREGSA